MQHLYEQTKNPLYVWEAIAVGLYAEPNIPEWCIPYLHKASLKLTTLGKSKIKIKHAQVLEALSLSSQGKRGAFAALQNDRRDMAEAGKHSSLFMRKTGLGLKVIGSSRSVEPDRARRILARGKRLMSPR